MSSYFTGFVLLLAAIACISSTQASVLGRSRQKRAAIMLEGMTGADELNMASSPTKTFSFNQMKDVISSEIINANMKKDIWLVKYLRANNDMSIPAIAMIKKALVFRKDQRIDTPTKPDVSQGYTKMEVSTSEMDLLGRVVLYYQVGSWGLSSAIKNNEAQLYEKTFYQFFEEAAQKAVDSYSNGAKHGQYVMVVDYEGWTSAEGGAGCGVPCADIVGRIVLNYGRTWPMFIHAVVIINTADDFKQFLELILPMLATDVRERMHVYGRKREEWCPEVRKLMDHSKLKKYCS